MIYDYVVELDIDDDRAYTNGLANLEGVKDIRWSAGMLAPYDAVGAPAEMRIVLNNNDGRYSKEDSAALYFGQLLTGRLIRVRMTYQDTTVTMTELVIAAIDQSLGERPDEFNPNPDVVLICTDRMKQLLGFEYYPILQQNVRIDEAITELFNHADVVWPSEKFYFFIDINSIDGTKNIYAPTADTDFEAALTSLAWVGDHMARKRRHMAQVFIRDLLRAEVYGMFFFQPRESKWRFFNRRHTQTVTSSGTMTTEDLMSSSTSFGRNPFGNGPLNDLSMDYEPRQQGAVDSILYSNQNVPFSIPAQSTRVIRGHFTDPDNADATVGALNVIQPARDIDFIANSKADGSGEDWTKFIIASFSLTATTCEFTFFVRKVGDPLFVTTMRCRGTPLVAYNPETVQAYDGLSVHANGRHQQSQPLTVVSDGDLAQRIADFYVSTYSTPTLAIEQVSIGIRDDNAALVQTLTMGDVITIHNSDSTHNREYVITAERHHVDIENGAHEVSYTLRPADTTTIFLIDSSSIDGPHVIDIG